MENWDNYFQEISGTRKGLIASLFLSLPVNIGEISGRPLGFEEKILNCLTSSHVYSKHFFKLMKLVVRSL